MRQRPAPPPEVKAEHGPRMLIPQRERVTFLVRLSEMFSPIVGPLTAFAVINGYIVLNVIPQDVSGRAVTVGCSYRDGQWWFYYVHTGVFIRPANELAMAARHIRTDMEQAGR
ncbi:hypothetical protein E1287_10090 [Actinomadura sp. KC06]|uniref:hypothetical protein n=1 Tax=Actinomadura sp. KC06 TaxID=2530369 RepID=UPI001053132E|nr:hypothetical protein [Actinomadura sp. KC06]TDD36860.1 hypothetical protein E1287_10090 [Actinomadura sp. KC06]